ncbi:MAG: hypothetical protein VYD19_04145 [Myxococcota bacterium]|nr:hypothetical protein [Myxococcota bacterium]
MRNQPLSLQKRGRRLLTTLILSSSALYSGCDAEVGDECQSNAECPGLRCDLNSAGGYCTVEDCSPGECPEGSVCATFPNRQRFCMARCEASEDCREDYYCESDPQFAAASFCRQGQ